MSSRQKQPTTAVSHGAKTGFDIGGETYPKKEPLLPIEEHERLKGIGGWVHRRHQSCKTSGDILDGTHRGLLILVSSR